MSAEEFEIYLLLTMACDDSLRDRELRRLNVSLQRAKKTKAEVSEATRPAPGQLDRLLDILGEGTTPETIQDDGHFTTVVRRVFDSWRAFTFTVTANELGIWTDARFVRTMDEPPAMPAHPEGLTPWEFTLDEVSEHFGPLTPGDSWHPFSEWGIPGPHGDYSAAFSWGLLQTVPRIDGSSG
ncbi:hypothetical protein [Actinomadura sediminis]|uniref:Uncharacterized protein n=1 Tax=Actinomadura sediminis TaxID=1038904 RepID=A0ABW3EP24_9ACTN